MKVVMRYQWVLLIFAVSTIGCCVSAQTLLYTVNLREQGCPVVEHKSFTRESELGVRTDHIGFDRTRNVYAGCAIQGDAKLLKPGEANNTFRVLKIDAESGQVIRKVDFPTQSKERTGINISANDSLLVTANDKVQLLGDDGSVKAAFDIPIDEKNEFLIGVRESPSGKTLLVMIDGASGYSPYFFHTDTLSLVTQCQIHVGRYGQDYPSTFADNVQMAHYQNNSVPGGPFPRDRLVIGPLCGQTEDLWDVSPDVWPVLLDDSTVLEEGKSKEDTFYTSFYEARKVTGETLWSEDFPKHFLAGVTGIAADGRRFAVRVEQLRGGHPSLDIGAKTVGAWIWIFDAKTGKRLGSIPISTNGNLRYALGPNGDRVAVLSADGSTLEVWKF
jgi:hypothetical protein